MKRKIRLLFSCLACCGMLICGMLPVEAMICKHTKFDIMICAPTGNVSYNTQKHTIEYGTLHQCIDCGYVYYTDTFTETEAHTMVWQPEGNNQYAYQQCRYCGYRKR